jgi:thiamine-phosphate pyrophosphorylase
MGDKRPPLPAGVYALLDDGLRPGLDLAAVAAAVLGAGVRVLQLRLKHTSDRPALALARAVVALARDSGAVVLINDRVDLALLAGAHGVHLGDDDLPLAEARQVLGPAALIGATTRSLAQIEAARAAGADHVGLGPIFASRTKPLAHALLGTGGLARIARESPLPIVAISGISLPNIAEIARAGAHCAAVAGAILEADDVAAAARALQAAFFTACPSPGPPGSTPS